MGRRGVRANTASEIAKLSVQEIDQYIAEARARVSFLTKASLRNATAKKLRLLEAARAEVVVKD